MGRCTKQSGMPLNTRFVESVRTPGRYGSGRGGFGLSLLVRVRANGTLSKTWSQRLRVHGKPVMIGLGTYPIVTLREARDAALENLRTLNRGDDPRTPETKVVTFRDAAAEVLRVHGPTWRAEGATTAWWASMENHVLPSIGHKPIAEVSSADVLSILKPLWNTQHETAKRAKQRIGVVMKHAITEGHRSDNPCDTVLAALPKRNGNGSHHRALDHSEVGAALATVAASSAKDVTKQALGMIALTACRSGEVRGMAWNEVDMESATWTIPASRMKAGNEHRVPLSTAALAILRERQRLSTGSLVFATDRGKMMTAAALSVLLKRNGVGGVVHGFRSSFRSWCADTGVNREVAEAALAHVVAGVEGAYQRSDLFSARREVMQQWSDYVKGSSEPLGQDV